MPDTPELKPESSNKSLLRRRNSLSTTFQSIWDGMVVIVLAVGITLFVNDSLRTVDIIAIMLLIGAMAVSYDRFSVYRQHGGMTRKALTLGKAWTVAFGTLLLIGFLSKSSELFSRQVGVLLYSLGYLFQMASHIALRSLQRRSHSHRPTSALTIGTGTLTNYLFNRVNTNPWINEEIVGAIVVPNDTDKDDKTSNPNNSPPILGEIHELKKLIVKHHIETVYITVSMDASPIIKQVYFDLLDSNVNIHWAPNIFSLQLLNHSVKEIAGIPILTLSETPLAGTHLLLKSIEDKMLASIILLLASPIMLIATLAIKLDSPGPVLFRQERTGWDGKPFRIWKFRSMWVDADHDNEVKQATRSDPRITRVGRFMRRTSIDELPQIFNVLSGDMSLVGPRPHATQHNRQYAHRITAYLSRHRIKPGITGLAQVRGLRGEIRDISQMEQRIKSDLEYINNWSIWLDLSILARTLFSLFSKNAY